MSNMIIGGHTLADNPSTCTMIRPDRICAGEQTYSSFSFFSWGMKLIGKQIDLTFSYMTASEFDTLDALYVADEQIVLDPQDGKGHTYNVQMKLFDGSYFHNLVGTNAMRKDVKMSLLIMSVAT